MSTPTTAHTTVGTDRWLMRGGYAMMALLPTSLTILAVVFVGMAVTAPAAAGSTRKVDVGFDPYMNDVSGKFSVSDCSDVDNLTSTRLVLHCTGTVALASLHSHLQGDITGSFAARCVAAGYYALIVSGV